MYLTSGITRYRRRLDEYQPAQSAVAWFKENLFPVWQQLKKVFKSIIEKNGSSLDLAVFSVQLTRLDNMDHLDLTNAK